jgi:hypothetical protein
VPVPREEKMDDDPPPNDTKNERSGEKQILFSEAQKYRLRELQKMGDDMYKERRKVLLPWKRLLIVPMSLSLFFFGLLAQLSPKGHTLLDILFLLSGLATVAFALWIAHWDKKIFDKTEEDFFVHSGYGEEYKKLRKLRDEAGPREESDKWPY